jgi:hypothetical protein
MQLMLLKCKSSEDDDEINRRHEHGEPSFSAGTEAPWQPPTGS